MPQAATLESLPRAFRMMKAMGAQGIEWGEDYRGAADRRNGSYRRWLMTELGEIELSVPRTRSCTGTQSSISLMSSPIG